MQNENIPNHVAIILDGNRRWAKERNLPSLMGHKKGAENIRTLSEYILSKGVKFFSVFAFSTENFKRAAEEVKYLMDIFVNEMAKEYRKIHEKGIKVVISGRRDGLRPDVLKAIEDITELTKYNTNGTFNMCLNYGGRFEIVDAAKKISEDVVSGKIKVENIDENLFNSYLYNDLPPIDLLIRTSGELRISNFMLWHMAYAEFYFPKVTFPDFDEKEFDKALLEYNSRERRFGGNAK